MAETTPMMRQYLQIKEKTPDCILFFRLGDFYEMFGEDARLASRELDLTLTTRDRAKENPEDRTPMCGVPYHASESYIARLISKGYNVAICEQMEDPALAKGLVDRDVVRIITPGTVTESSMLVENRSNYICTVFDDGHAAAVCFADISTGEMTATGFEGGDRIVHIQNELGRFQPAEAVLSTTAAANHGLTRFLSTRLECRFHHGNESRFNTEQAYALVRGRFGEDSVPDSSAVVTAAGALLSYLEDTQKTELAQINTLRLYSDEQYMELDLMTRRNLELTETLRTKQRRGSLLWVLDRTKTSMGGRLLRKWVERPLLGPALILRRQNAVAELKDAAVLRGELAELLNEMYDMERLIGRISFGSTNCRDLSSLGKTISVLPRIVRRLEGSKSQMLAEIADMDTLTDLQNLIEDAVIEDPPFSVREGGMIRPGYSAEVDRLRDVMQNGKSMVADIELRERERTGVKKLKVGYNKVFGYYIEMPRSGSENPPEDYIRKQTLANAERFITMELKELEDTLLNAKDRVTALEYKLFTELTGRIRMHTQRVQRTAELAAQLDVLVSLAAVAADNDYCRPQVDVSDVIHIRDGRHPVVEKMGGGELFVPNDALLDTDDNRVSIITGPNMAGKSTYMRQVALITLMAQIGSFVPAGSAAIGIVDRIFTRIGASDDLASGQSTFMLEMTEVADILRDATKKSLIVLDEIGRGTSTFDGMAIARAVLEHCADSRRLGAKTLFATHYHELTVLEQSLEGVRNYNITVKKRGEDVIFLRKIVPGPADKSYGIEVARLAGVPERIIRRARALLDELESGRAEFYAAEESSPEEPSGQIGFGDMQASAVAERLRMTDANTLTPIEALNLIFELKKLC